MKVLLLNPPTYDNRAFIREGRCNQEQGVWSTLWPPVTLATAGAMLEISNHRVDILDCAARGIRVKELLMRIRKGKYALAVWAAATPSIHSDLALAKEIKKAAPGIKTGTLGTHVTALADRCLHESRHLDFIIRNEPEESLTVLAEALEKGTGIENVQGISYRNETGQVYHNHARPFINDLDKIPFPAWHLLDLEEYRLPLTGERFLILAPLRGCPYQCTFCTAQTYYGRKIRKNTVPRIMEEIKYMMNRFDINQFFIWADTFTADQDYVFEFCRHILRSKLNIGWTCNSRVDTVDGRLLTEMKRAGCWMISYGIEAGDQAVLDKARKNITVDQCREAVRLAKEAGIKVAAHFVLGLPGETEETLAGTIDLALDLDPEVAQFYCAVPFPGSSLYEFAGNQGWIETKGFEEFSQNNATMDMPGLPPSVVNRYRKKGFRRFYLRPNRFLRLSGLMRAGGIGKTIKGGAKFIRWMASSP